jgi:hypothetical protein
MPFNKGESGNKDGRPKGSLNKQKDNVYASLINDIFNMFKSGKYYVYYHIDVNTKEIVYIGKGKNNRAWDFRIGTRNQEWNEYIKNNKINAKLIVVDVSEEEALAIEKSLIQVKNPILNNMNTNNLNK